MCPLFSCLLVRHVRRKGFYFVGWHGDNLTCSLNKAAASRESPNKKHTKEQAAKLLGDLMGWDVTMLETGRMGTGFSVPQMGRKGRTGMN